MIIDEQLNEWDLECRKLIKRHEIYEKECIFNDQCVEWDISFAFQIVQLVQALRAERKCNAVLREACLNILKRDDKTSGEHRHTAKKALAEEAEIRGEL